MQPQLEAIEPGSFSGLPMALLSAQLTTERVLKEIGVPQPTRNSYTPMAYPQFAC